MKKTGTHLPTELLLERDLKKLTDKKPTKGSRRSLHNNNQISRILGHAARYIESDVRSTSVYIHTVSNMANECSVSLPDWRRLTEKNKVIFYHLALKSLSEQQPGHKVVPFTMNLTANVVDRAKTGSDSFSKHLQERIRTNLRRKLKRPVDFFFCVEIAPQGSKGRPHLHGEILLTDSELKSRKTLQPVREALHMINDYSAHPDFHRHAIRFNHNRCDTGWAAYSAKHESFSNMYFDGKPIVCTRGCNQEARKLWSHLKSGSLHEYTPYTYEHGSEVVQAQTESDSEHSHTTESFSDIPDEVLFPIIEALERTQNEEEKDQQPSL